MDLLILLILTRRDINDNHKLISHEKRAWKLSKPKKNHFSYKSMSNFMKQLKRQKYLIFYLSLRLWIIQKNDFRLGLVIEEHENLNIKMFMKVFGFFFVENWNAQKKISKSKKINLYCKKNTNLKTLALNAKNENIDFFLIYIARDVCFLFCKKIIF